MKFPFETCKRCTAESVVASCVCRQQRASSSRPGSLSKLKRSKKKKKRETVCVCLCAAILRFGKIQEEHGHIELRKTIHHLRHTSYISQLGKTNLNSKKKKIGSKNKHYHQFVTLSTKTWIHFLKEKNKQKKNGI